MRSYCGCQSVLLYLEGDVLLGYVQGVVIQLPAVAPVAARNVGPTRRQVRLLECLAADPISADMQTDLHMG